MKKIIFSAVFLIFLISFTPISFGQISIGEKAVQKSIKVYFELDKINVIHEVRGSMFPKQIDFVSEVISNIQVIDDNGKEVIYSTLSDGKSESAIVVMSSKEDYKISYDLPYDNKFNMNYVKWDFFYNDDVSFIFPESVNFIYVNNNLIMFDGKKGITCHGCQMILEFSLNYDKNIINVNWEDRKFAVEFLTDVKIEELIFDQQMKTISFDVKESEKHVLTLIPLELLWGPYVVFLDDEKIQYNDNYNNGTHVWIHVKPETTGTVSIIGTTVVPEFSMFIPLIMGFMIILTVPLVKKFSLR